MQTTFHTESKNAPPSLTPVRAGVLQRKCACGGSAGVTSECGDCDKKKLSLQRSTENHRETLNSGGVQLSVHDVPRSLGQPLPVATPDFMEPRSGHDFGRVRVHPDWKAAPEMEQRDQFTVGFAPFGSRLVGQSLDAGADEPFTQGLSEGQDPLHAPMLEEYRRAAGQPPGGIDEAGNQVGPSDAELKYGRLPLAMPGAAQTTARFVAGATHRVWDLAPRIIARNGDLGFTPPLLNGSQISSAATAIAAIHRPSLGQQTTAAGVETWVNSIPNNEASFDMTLPTAGPWSSVTPKTSIAGLVRDPACAGAGDTTFTVNGDPDNATMLANLERHERHHATDHETVFNAVAAPWHTLMTEAQGMRRIFRGVNVAAAEASLHAAMGGAPDTIATNLWNGWIGANNTFHGSPAGATASITGTSANPDCSVSSIRFSHP